MKTQALLLAACTGIVMCVGGPDELSDGCDFSDLNLEKMVDKILRRFPPSYSLPGIKPQEIILGITMGPAVVNGLDSFVLYGPVFSYCRNGTMLVQVDLLTSYPIELSANWKTCNGKEGEIGTYGKARVTVTFEVVNATGEANLQEKRKKLVLHGLPKAVDVSVVSAYIRGAGELFNNVASVIRALLPHIPREFLTGVLTFERPNIFKDLTERP